MYDSLVNSVRREMMQNAMSGEKYITESDLCARTGTSRTRLRETLKTLDSYGMIERKQKCGVALCSYSREELEELFEIRVFLESRVADRTVQNATEQDLFELYQIENEIGVAVKFNNHIERSIKDALFHRKLIQISGSETTLRIINALQLLESTMVVPEERTISPDPYTHYDMIEAIANGDNETYKSLLVKHIEWVAIEMLDPKANGNEKPNGDD